MIEFSDAAQVDLEEIFEFNHERDPDTALDHVDKIRSAIRILDTHPEIGRRRFPNSRLRELVISRGRSGYIALYAYFSAANRVRILSIKHQREVGYLSY
jgi:plasmid stabilization system protein ParE